jgi:pSer/pThr/pTyr-binding forkhead associated (FHA) protein
VESPNQNKPNSIESPCYTSPDSEPIPCTGPEARIVDPSGASNSIALKVGSNSIGREANQDIQLDDPKVSKKHADLNVSPEGRYVVTDLGSQNGTTVNGTKIKQPELYQGDQIGLGDSRIIV